MVSYYSTFSSPVTEVTTIRAAPRSHYQARESYPEVALLNQIKGVGTLIALTFSLTLEDPHRFRGSA